jgi:hypothetical protein
VEGLQVVGRQPGAAAAAAAGLPSGEAPTYIPSMVKPEVTAQHITGEEATSDAEGVVASRQKLRALRSQR